MSCGFDYDDSIDTTKIESVIHDIFSKDEDYTFMLNKLSLCLEGFNREQQIVLNYGHRASNGKSFIMELMSDAVGDYGATFPVNMLTSKMKTAGEADSTLSRFINKRFLYCSEPEANAKLASPSLIPPTPPKTTLTSTSSLDSPIKEPRKASKLP